MVSRGVVLPRRRNPSELEDGTHLRSSHSQPGPALWVLLHPSGPPSVRGTGEEGQVSRLHLPSPISRLPLPQQTSRLHAWPHVPPGDDRTDAYSRLPRGVFPFPRGRVKH